MRIHARALTMAALVAACPVRVSAQTAEIAISFWKPTPELVLSTDDVSQANLNEVDFVNEFGIEEKQFPEFRGTFGRRHKVRVSRVLFEYDAEATIRRRFTFRGRTFNIGAPAKAEVSWDLWTFGYEWDFVSRPEGFVGLIVDAKRNKVRGSIDSPVLPSAARTEIDVWAPTVGIIARAYAGRALALTGEVTALPINRKDFLARYVDYDVSATLFFGGHIGAQAGLRSVDVEYLIDDDKGHLRMRGPYFGGVLKF